MVLRQVEVTRLSSSIQTDSYNDLPACLREKIIYSPPGKTNTPEGKDFMLYFSLSASNSFSLTLVSFRMEWDKL